MFFKTISSCERAQGHPPQTAILYPCARPPTHSPLGKGDSGAGKARLRPLPGSQTLGTAAALTRLTFLYQIHVANAPGAHLSYQLYPVPTGLLASAESAGGTEGQDTIPTLWPIKQSRTPQIVTMKLTFIKQLLRKSSREAPACQLRPSAQGALQGATQSMEMATVPAPAVLGAHHWTAGTPWAQTSRAPCRAGS